MNKTHGLTVENALAALPRVLRNDKNIYALAAAVVEILAAKRPAEIDRLRIYTRIDQLDEELLDILAYDFKVDWWNPDYSLEEKRRTMKDSWRVHRMLGTKAAVETAISDIYPGTTLQEWFEYGGAPYSFRMTINATDIAVNTESHRRVLELVSFYKNLRSHLDYIIYTIFPAPARAVCASAFCGGYMCITVQVRLTGKVGKPHVDVPAWSAAGLTGMYTRTEALVRLTGKVGKPQTTLHAWAALGPTGTYARVEAAIQLTEPARKPQNEYLMHTAVKAAGTYTKVTMEVVINGLD